jgi:hypothetical protein
MFETSRMNQRFADLALQYYQLCFEAQTQCPGCLDRKDWFSFHYPNLVGGFNHPESQFCMQMKADKRLQWWVPVVPDFISQAEKYPSTNGYRPR